MGGFGRIWEDVSKGFGRKMKENKVEEGLEKWWTSGGPAECARPSKGLISLDLLILPS